MTFGKNILVKSWETGILCFHFLNLAISGTLFSACFENESEVEQEGEQRCVMYDQDKELCRCHVIIIYLFFYLLKPSLHQAKTSLRNCI